MKSTPTGVKQIQSSSCARLFLTTLKAQLCELLVHLFICSTWSLLANPAPCFYLSNYIKLFLSFCIYSKFCSSPFPWIKYLPIDTLSYVMRLPLGGGGGVCGVCRSLSHWLWAWSCDPLGSDVVWEAIGGVGEWSYLRGGTHFHDYPWVSDYMNNVFNRATSLAWLPAETDIGSNPLSICYSQQSLRRTEFLMCSLSDK